MPFDGLSKSTIVDITEDSSEESEDEDVSYIPSMNLEDHCYEEDVDQNSDDNIMCGWEDAIICKEYLIFQYFYFAYIYLFAIDWCFLIIELFSGAVTGYMY